MQSLVNQKGVFFIFPVDMRLFAHWRERSLAGGPTSSVRCVQRPMDWIRQREEPNVKGISCKHGVQCITIQYINQT